MKKKSFYIIKILFLTFILESLLFFNGNIVLGTEIEDTITVESDDSSVDNIEETSTICIQPTEKQYLELRAVEIKEPENLGDPKQVIFELWGNDIEFAGFDVRFSYDSSKINPSSIDNNEMTTDVKKYFKFENEFASNLMINSLAYDAEGSGIRAVVSLKQPAQLTQHIVDKGEARKDSYNRWRSITWQNEFPNDGTRT